MKTWRTLRAVVQIKVCDPGYGERQLVRDVQQLIANLKGDVVTGRGVAATDIGRLDVMQYSRVQVREMVKRSVRSQR